MNKKIGWENLDPTVAQKKYIESIKEVLDISFEGKTRKDASEFILKHRRELERKYDPMIYDTYKGDIYT